MADSEELFNPGLDDQESVVAVPIVRITESATATDSRYIAYRIKSYMDATGKTENEVIALLGGMSPITAYTLGITIAPDTESSDYTDKVREIANTLQLPYSTLLDVISPII